jgi:hypothetical protein
MSTLTRGRRSIAGSGSAGDWRGRRYRSLPGFAIAALAALAIGAVGAPAARAATCPPPTVAQTFAPWKDPALYMTAPDGGLEAGGAGWTLAGGAAVVSGNEPFYVRAATDHRSLALPTGAVATTPKVCIGVEHPTVRFFARNTGSALSRLTVSVIYTGLDGHLASLTIGQLVAGSVWAPTPVVPVVVDLLSLLGNQYIAFRFAPADSVGSWRIDDVYVDPYGKR